MPGRPSARYGRRAHLVCGSMVRMALKLGILTPFLWSTPVGRQRPGAARSRDRLTAAGHRVTVIAPSADRAAVEEAQRRVQAVLTGERETVFLPGRAVPALLLRRRHLRGQGRAAPSSSSRRRRTSSPTSTCCWRPRTSTSCTSTSPSCPASAGRRCATPAARWWRRSTPTPRGCGRSGPRGRSSGVCSTRSTRPSLRRPAVARRRGGLVPGRLPGHPAGRRPRGLPPARASVPPDRCAWSSAPAPSGARDSACCCAPCGCWGTAHAGVVVDVCGGDCPGAPLRAPRAARLAGPRPLPRARCHGRRSPPCCARADVFCAPSLGPETAGRRAARGDGLRRRRRRLADPRLRRGRAERGHGPAGAAARRRGARGGALAPAGRDGAASPALDATPCAPPAATTGSA